jgi:hypothetical protein
MQAHTYQYVPCRSHIELVALQIDVEADNYSIAKTRACALWEANDARADFAILRDFAGYLIWSSPSAQ